MCGEQLKVSLDVFFSVYKMQYILLLNKKENEHFGQELA